MNEGKEKRAFPREKLRAVCDLGIDGATHSGFVADISARGLFVQTRAELPAGGDVEVTLRNLGPAPVRIRARVARRRTSHRATRAVDTGGVGLEIVAAGEDFYRALHEILG